MEEQVLGKADLRQLEKSKYLSHLEAPSAWFGLQAVQGAFKVEVKDKHYHIEAKLDLGKRLSCKEPQTDEEYIV